MTTTTTIALLPTTGTAKCRYNWHTDQIRWKTRSRRVDGHLMSCLCLGALIKMNESMRCLLALVMISWLWKCKYGLAFCLKWWNWHIPHSSLLRFPLSVYSMLFRIPQPRFAHIQSTFFAEQVNVVGCILKLSWNVTTVMGVILLQLQFSETFLKTFLKNSFGFFESG